MPYYLWGETIWYSFLSAYIIRYIVSLHGTWFVNSAAVSVRIRNTTIFAFDLSTSTCLATGLTGRQSIQPKTLGLAQSLTVKVCAYSKCYVTNLTQTYQGYHNYHHAYPADYRASEMGHGLNITVHFINAMALIGQAYDLKTASKSAIQIAKSNAKNDKLRKQ